MHKKITTIAIVAIVILSFAIGGLVWVKKNNGKSKSAATPLEQKVETAKVEDVQRVQVNFSAKTKKSPSDKNYQLTDLYLNIDGSSSGSYYLGEFGGDCVANSAADAKDSSESVVDDSRRYYDWLGASVGYVSCWYGGAGDDIAIFREGDFLVAKKISLDEQVDVPSPDDAVVIEKIPVPASTEVVFDKDVRNMKQLQGGNYASVYSSLKEKDCVGSKEDKSSLFFQQECKGIEGYVLKLLEIDMRQALNVIAPDKKEYKLNFGDTISESFSYFGDTAEWRVARENGKSSPRALIVRFNTYESPEDVNRITTRLVVSKITSEEICIVGHVQQSADMNEQARIMADNAQSMPCLKK